MYICTYIIYFRLLGRMNVVTTNAIDLDKLRTDVFCGPPSRAHARNAMSLRLPAALTQS